MTNPKARLDPTDIYSVQLCGGSLHSLSIWSMQVALWLKEECGGGEADSFFFFLTHVV